MEEQVNRRDTLKTLAALLVAPMASCLFAASATEPLQVARRQSTGTPLSRGTMLN